jgi:hypothetical protein
MNQGFLGFPGLIDRNQLDFVKYDTSGVYQIMPGTRGLYIFAIGGGGGGGGGARQATSTNAFGGGGGGGGRGILYYFSVEDLGGVGSSLFIAIGAGGSAGAAGATDSSNGGSGGGGGQTNIFLLGKGSAQNIGGSVATLLSVGGGSQGTGGSTTTGSAGTGNRMFLYDNYEAQSLAGNGANSNGNISVYNICVHGGAGGGSHALGTPTNGGSILIQVATTIPQTIALDYAKNTTAFAGGIANSATGPSNSSTQMFGTFSPGYGGAGGGPGTTRAATAGANGYRGSGGGGGGGSANGFAAGVGGNGGNGFVAIKAVY